MIERYSLPEMAAVWGEERKLATWQEVEGYLEGIRSFPKTAATYISPSGIFEFTYSTSGGNGVPVNSSGPAGRLPASLREALWAGPGRFSESCNDTRSNCTESRSPGD